MRAAYLLAATIIAFSAATAARAQQALEYDYIQTPDWLMAQQYVGPSFDSCIARSKNAETGQTLTIGRSITGDDFILVHNIGGLIAPDETKAHGRVWINGNTPYDFNDTTVFDSAMNPGQKYVSIFLGKGFVDLLAKANSVDVEFSFGRSSHSLRGSGKVISKFDACVDNGLSIVRQEAAAPPPPPPPPPPPVAQTPGWDSTTPPQGQGVHMIGNELPLMTGQPPGAKNFIAIVDNGNGRYEIRFRHDAPSILSRFDVNAPTAKRFAATVGLRGTTPFTTLAVVQDNGLDILDILPADLAKLGSMGFVHVESVDPSTPYKLDIPFLGNTVSGPAAILAPPPPPPAPVAAPVTNPTPLPLTLETLVGKYYVRGRNPNGNYYYGDAEAVIENGMLRINWIWRDGKTDTGQANLVSNLLTAIVPGFPDPVLYTIGKDHVWRGTWAKGTATEVFVPR